MESAAVGEQNSTILLSTAYLPPVAYFAAVAHSQLAAVEACETFQKQSYRNRCNIYSPDGVQQLLVPVLHAGSRFIRDIRIDYSKNWQHHHRRAIATAYGPTPFFKYYWDDIDTILGRKHEFLFDMNMELTEKLLQLLEIRTPIGITSDYESAPTGLCDLRSAIHPKREWPDWKPKEYYQSFCDRHGWLPNLSVIDLLFSEGPEAASYL